MHNGDLTVGVIHGLGWLYLLLFAMNAVWTYRLYMAGPAKHDHDSDHKPSGDEPGVVEVAVWGLITTAFFLVGWSHLTTNSPPEEFQIVLPGGFKEWTNIFAIPVVYFVGTTALLVAVLWFRRWLSSTKTAWILLNVSIVFMALSLTDYDFRQIVGKPDNVPIVSMLFIASFFTWVYFRQAVRNDDAIAAGKPLPQTEDNEKVLVWPDLVYSELICMVLCTALLIAWGVVLEAPLEEAASSVKTPNPSKAPWYFLGLQEMLVYFDPWMAGVVLPTMIVLGLMALPYIDFNKAGNGYYTFTQRKFAICTFLFGFAPLWMGLIVLGTFLRGPNWNFFGIYEPWDPHKLDVLNNVNLSEYFWLDFMGQKLPSAASDAGFMEKLGAILLRESLGLIAILIYAVAVPPLLALTVFRSFFLKMGFLRFMVLANLIQFMAILPIKMVLRWTIELKYIVAIPEYFFNI